MGRVLGQVMAAEEKPVDYQCKAMEWMMNFKEVNSVNDCCYHVWNCYDREPYAQGRLRLIHENNIDLLWELGRCPERDLSEREMSYVAGFLEKGLAERRGRGMFLGGYPDYVQMMVRKGELQCGKKGAKFC